MTDFHLSRFPFLENKYSVWYFAIIERAKHRDLDGYFERHHVVPRALGGRDECNLVNLTFREHFLAHWLLIGMTEGEAQRKMRMAIMRMCHSGRKIVKNKKVIIPSWAYNVARKAMRDAQVGTKNPGVHTDEFKANLRASLKGNSYAKGKKHTRSSEFRAKMRAAFTEERRAALILRNKTVVAAKLKGQKRPEVAEANKRRKIIKNQHPVTTRNCDGRTELFN